MTNPLLFYVSIAAAIAGFASGWGVRDWKAGADQLKTIRQSEIMREKAQAKTDNQATNYEQWRAGLEPLKIGSRDTIREIYRNVEVPANCAAPADIVSLLNAATDKANAASTGQLGSAVPTTDATARPAR